VTALGVSELAEDPRFYSDMLRFENRVLLQPIFSKIAGNYRAAEFVDNLQKARVPCGEIKTPAEMVKDSQINARDMLVNVEHPGIGKVTLPGIVPKLSHSPGMIRKRASKLGEDNEKIYMQQLGLTKDKLEILKKDGVI
ncbi:MAG: CoA transferase, partial [Syntrophales bacterium LBB04]|nr:CoA transferase [Syntrophales bacterium LBB04]